MMKAMKHLFPALTPRETFQGPVLVVVPHPDDEVIGCGAMMAWHASRGHRVVVVHATDGAGGDPEGKFGDIASLRKAESARALEILGVREWRELGFPDGRLEEAGGLEKILEDLLRRLQPRTFYTLSPLDNHKDHRVLARAAAAAAFRALPPEAECLVMGINNMGLPNILVDITDLLETKERALRAFQSQLAYLDFATKVVWRDKAATVNIEDPGVKACEAFMRLPASRLPEFLEKAEALEGVLYPA